MKDLSTYYRKILMVSAMTLGLATACTERIDVELDDTYTRLVVDAQLSTDSTIRQTVILTESSSYFYNQPPPPVANADVTLSDDKGNTYLLTEENPGRYHLPQGFSARSGTAYTLDIELAEAIDGKTGYNASTETPGIGDTVYIGLQYQPDWGDDGFYIVQCYYWDPPGPNFYMFDIFKNDTLLTDTINEKQVVDDRFYDGGFTNGIGVGYLNQSKKSERLRPGDVITFRASSITEGYANFVWQVQEETGFSTPLFSGPPANVSGNISGGAIGYFTAYPVRYASTVFE